MLRELARRIAGSDPNTRHSLLHPGNQLMVQERERALAGILAKWQKGTLEDLKVFEAGCGGGYNLRMLVQWGCDPENLFGVDIDSEQIQYSRSRSPEIAVHAVSAEQVSQPDGAFDMSIAFTLFSSVRDEDLAAAIAAEMYRLTRPGGLILVYDMRRANPYNSAIRPIGPDDIRRWFPKCPMRNRPITLAPPLARPIGKRAPWLYRPLAAIRPLRSHALYVIRRPSAGPGFD
ncbi:MAG: class I SAM-dependent methyltransferase [Tepidiformaceae bacterium]